MKCFQAQLWGQCLCVCVYKHTHTDIQPYSCDCLWCRIPLCRKHYRGREKWDLLSQATALHVSRKAVCTSHSPSLFRTALESFHKDPFFCNQDPILYRCSQWDMFRWYITKTSVLCKDVVRALLIRLVNQNIISMFPVDSILEISSPFYHRFNLLDPNLPGL